MSNPQENVNDVVTEQPNAQAGTVNEVELEIVEATPEQEESVSTGSPPTASPARAFDPKTDKVEFNTPEQQKKFDYIYKQTKMSDARNNMLTDLLQKQQEKLDTLEGRFKQTDSADAERMLATKIKQARDSGDDYAEIAATTEMVNFLADKKISERVNKSPQQIPQLPQDSPEAKYVEAIINEKDTSGQSVRPWFNEQHPEFNNALSTLEEIKYKYAGDPFAIPRALAEVDQIMRARMTTQKPAMPQTPSRAPSPMQGGNLTNVKQKTTIKMTRQELEIARKLGVDPKAYAARRDTIAGRK